MSDKGTDEMYAKAREPSGCSEESRWGSWSRATLSVMENLGKRNHEDDCTRWHKLHFKHQFHDVGMLQQKWQKLHSRKGLFISHKC